MLGKKRKVAKKAPDVDGDAKNHLATILKKLSGSAISYGSTEVYSAGLNIIDQPYVKKYIPEIARHLHEQVVKSEIEYDAVVSIPRGGNAWADALIECAKADGREVPFYRLNKVSTREFSIIDGQPVKRGAKLLLTDDTLWQAKNSKVAVKVLEGAGFKVAGLVFPVEIGLSGRHHWDNLKYPVFSIYNNAFVQDLHRQRHPVG